MPILLYDSRHSACKTPFGAVKTGETVTFTINLPKIHHNAAPVLKIYRMDSWEEPTYVIPMGMLDADYLANRFTCVFTPDTPSLYAYGFEFFSEGQLQVIRRGKNGRGVLDENAGFWQLTVYDAAMHCPRFLREGVLYQIFPDRFAYSGQPKEGVPEDRWLRTDWGAIPQWRPNEKGEVTNSDYFQGDLKGIQQKLDYLESLGVTAIYLNPIFEAHANHRYNTADYRKVDPLLGTEQDLADLCAAAGEKGISIILDCAFSHTGSDSIYFNKERRYGDGGAYNDPDGPYREWYQFFDYPEKYDSWWGFQTLPNVNECAPSYLEFICGDDGVLRKWQKLGVAGFRLDVADELPDAFLDRLHDCVKSYDPETAVIGEVWEDASNKESYGVRRRYLQGGQLDSVMNYPFKNAILTYIRWGASQLLYDTILQILENYPKPAIQALMNSLSTHDTVRAITELAGQPMEQHDRDWQEQHHYLTEEQFLHGVKLMKLACILQFGLPGVPCVYYGDEAGLSGYRDPFNRVCYPWGNENKELVEFIRTLGNIRRTYPIFAEAAFLPLTFSREICAFVRQTDQMSIAFVVNRSKRAQRINKPVEFENIETLAVAGEFDGWKLGPHSGAVLLARHAEQAHAQTEAPEEEESTQRLSNLRRWLRRSRVE